MNRKAMKAVMTIGLAALCGCAGMSGELRPASVEQLGERGVSAPILSVEAGTSLRFVNTDARPHQIYSNDCEELSSTVLNPGDTYLAAIGNGPKQCHFQDLLAPLSTGYHGSVQVHGENEERLLQAAAN